MLPDGVRATALALAFILIAPAWGCGDDEVPSDDGDDDSDAGVDAGTDAGDDAGDDLCPGLLTFEALVAQSGAPEVAVTVAEVGGSAATSSAPNGRAQLCLPADAESLQVRSTKEGFLPRLDTLIPGAIEIANAAAQPYPLDVLGAEAAQALRDDLDVPQDEETTLLLVSVVAYPDALPLAGATVAIDGANAAGSFASDASGAFLPAGTDAIGEGRTLLFANVISEGEEGQAAITVTPPEEFAGTCVGPPTVALEPGGISGALFSCQ